MSSDLRPELAVIGGSGFYTFLEDPKTIEVETPYGAPSAPIAVGRVDGKAVAFLPRHGNDHQFPAHQVPYRANLWALRSLGVRQILAPCAVGGLQEAYGPGTFVVPDQLVDQQGHPRALGHRLPQQVCQLQPLKHGAHAPAR